MGSLEIEHSGRSEVRRLAPCSLSCVGGHGAGGRGSAEAALCSLDSSLQSCEPNETLYKFSALDIWRTLTNVPIFGPLASSYSKRGMLCNCELRESSHFSPWLLYVVWDHIAVIMVISSSFVIPHWPINFLSILCLIFCLKLIFILPSKCYSRALFFNMPTFFKTLKFSTFA